MNINFQIGKNAQDNFNIIDQANENDLWFHLADYPSCHVIASIPNLNISKKELKKIIKQGALLCKINSKYKKENNLEVIYTEVKNVKKTEVIGEVITSNIKTIFI
jgi:predicted ribosome quality control (RQC) complex YloA/Tae2 family protein